MEIRRSVFENKVWGEEEKMADFPDRGYCGKFLHLDRGYRCSIHSHPKDETFYIQSGRVFLELEDERGNLDGAILTAGDIVDIFDKKWHRFSGLRNSVIIEFSQPDTESDRRTTSEKIPDYENWKDKIEAEYGGERNA